MISKRAVSLYFFFFVNYCLFAQPPKLVLPIGHTESVYSAKFSPDGKLILTISKDHTAKLWDATTGILLNTLKGHTDEIYSAVFSPDGERIATASSDGTCRIWETLTGKIIKVLEGHEGRINTVQFSLDGDALLTVATDKSFRIWNFKTGNIISKVFDVALRANAAEGDFVVQAQFSPDGKSVLSSSQVYFAQVWDAATGKLKFNLENKPFIEYAVFSNDGNWLVTDNIIRRGDNGGWFGGQPNVVNVWNARTGKLFKTLHVAGGEINSIEFSPDSKKLVAHANNKVTVLNTTNWKKISEFSCPADYTVNMPYDYTRRTVQFNPVEKSNQVIARSGDSVMIWDIAQGKLLALLEGTFDRSASFQFSSDGKKIVAGSNQNNGIVWDAVTGKQLLTLKINGALNAIHSVIISPADKWILTVMENGVVNIWEASTGKLFNSFIGYKKFVPIKGKVNVMQPVAYTKFSPDEKYIITYQNNDTAKLWEIATAKPLCSFTKYGVAMENYSGDNIKFSPDRNRVTIFSLRDSSMLKLDEVYSFDPDLLLSGTGFFGLERTGRYPKISWKSAEIKKFRFGNCAEGWCEAPYMGEIYITFSKRHNWVATVTSDNTVKIIDTASEKELYSFFNLDSSDYFVQSAAGYYLTTANAAKLLHYVTPDLKVISFEQLDVKYNRPDIILQTLGNTDTALLQSYRNAYYKRIKKLGIDTSAFNYGYSVPESDFANRDEIKYEQNNEKLNLQIKGIDSAYTLDRFNCWINEVPVFGMRGTDIKKRFRKNMDTTITVSLSEGINRIETSVTSLSGAESYRKPLLVKYIPEKIIPSKIYFIGIGINEFADSSNNLKWCVQDIRDLTTEMRIKYADQLVVLDTLYNDKVTLSNIKALKQKLLNTAINDKVIISYSGHGLLSKDYDYYLSSYNINFKKPEEGGIPYEAFENLLDSIPARKKLLLLDACHSGEVDKDEIKKVSSSATSLEKNNNSTNPGSRVVIVGSTGNKSTRLGLQNSFDLMQSLFVNVGKGTGAIIISASGGVQFAQENSTLGHGVFTYSVIEAMKKFPHLKVSEFKKYVGESVTQLTNGLQKPTTRNETIAVDWEVW